MFGSVVPRCGSITGPSFGIARFDAASIHDLATGSVDEYGSGSHHREELIVRHSSCRLVKGHVQGHYVSVGQQIVQSAETFPIPSSAILGGSFFRTLKPKDPATESTLRPTLPTPTIPSVPPSSSGTGSPCVAAAPVKSSENVVHHPSGIAAGRVPGHDPFLFVAVRKVYVIHPDCRRGDELHRSAFEQRRVTLGPGPDDQSVGVHRILARDGPAFLIDDIRIRFQNTFDERNRLSRL